MTIRAATLSFAPGAQLGKYELLAEIGSGGMANVLLARQRGPAGFEKLVVIKALLPCFVHNKEIVGMLRDEARVGARVDHPNVVHTYELGEASGTYYIAMEYLAGESLSYILKTCRRSALDLPPVFAAKIVANVAEGLHAAHELEDSAGKRLGIIHRDVSPENIIVLYNGSVKIVDFGIAKSTEQLTKTQHGVIKGKYAYMSPEQVLNDPLDRRSDVFSLGIVLWEALTQQRLFYAPDVLTTLSQILREPRVAPSRIRPSVPRGLDDVALTALQLDPARRYQSAAAFARAIEDAIWHCRCGSIELRSFMQGAFPERVLARRRLLSCKESLTDSQRDLLAQLHEEPGPEMTSVPTTASPPPRFEKRGAARIALRLGLVFMLAIVVASLIAMSGSSLATPELGAHRPTRST